MVLSKTLFLFTFLFLAGYYTPIYFVSQIWMAVIPVAVVLISMGRLRSGIFLLCIVSFLAGANFDLPRPDSLSSPEPAGGVWHCTIETSTTAGALLNTDSGKTFWTSNRELAGSVSRGDSLIVIGSINGSFMHSHAFHTIQSSSLPNRARRAVSRSLVLRIPSRVCSSLAAALIAGERGNLPESVRRVFGATGTSHLLALSGLHVAILSGFLLVLFRKIFGRGWVSIAAVILCVFAYVFVSGARASTLRAGVMLLLILVIWFSSGRTPDLLFVWSVAVIVLTIVSKGNVLNDTGAQMSFAAVLSLIFMGRQFRGRAGRVLSVVYAGLVVTIALAPLVSFRYGGLSPVAPIATVISIPFMLATMIGGSFSLFWPFTAAVSVLSEWIVFIWMGILEYLDSGMVVFEKWMFWLWPVCLAALWLFSGRRGFRRRFR